MKKITAVFLLVILLCLAACGKTTTNTDTPANDTPTATVEPTPTEPAPPAAELLPLSEDAMTFSYLSGAGGWQTVMTVNRDGTFSGFYSDSELGEAGEGYPNGSIYMCDFSGKFGTIEKINEYSYKLILTDISTAKAVGEEWIEDEIRYVAAEPHGLNDPFEGQECTEFILYLPDTPVDSVPEDFLNWWPLRYSQETMTTLSCFGILNVTTNSGFFTAQ